MSSIITQGATSGHVLHFPGGAVPQTVNQQPASPTNPAGSPASTQRRAPLAGGTLDPTTALALMNSWFFVSERDGEVGIYRIEDGGALTYLGMDDFKLRLANIFVDVSSQTHASHGKLVGIDKFWLRHPDRRSCSKIVFEPSGKIVPDEYNLWRGFAICPKRGYQKQRRLLQHIVRIICKRNKVKFKYLMKQGGEVRLTQ
jgi:hypothetical protein